MSRNLLEEEAKRNQALAIEEEEAKQRRSVVSPNAGLDTLVQCNSPEHQNDIVLAYNNFFGGKPGYIIPTVNQNGSVSLSFPEKGGAEAFSKDQAKKGQRFMLIDEKTETVMAYSNGHGTLYHVDGSEFQKSDTLKPSSISKNDFVLPEPGSKLGM